MGCVCFLPTRMAISTLSAICLPNVRLNSSSLPPSSTMPGVMMIRRPGKALITRSAHCAPTGFALNASSMMLTPAPPSSSSSRCSTGWQCDTPSAISGRVMPSARAAVQHSSRLEMECSPSSRVWQFASSPVWISTSVNRVPHGPQAMSLASTSMPGLYFFSSGQRSNSSSQIAPSRAKIAVPSFGRPSISSYFVSRTRSIVPNVSRCCGPTDVINPICGCTSSTSSRISPTWRAPISAINT